MNKKITAAFLAATLTITALAGCNDVSENTSSNTNAPSTSSNSSSGQTHYDAELNEHYDDNGVIQGGQNDGMDINEVKNNVPQIDEEGLN